MKEAELNKALRVAVGAARSAGDRLRRHVFSHKAAREVSKHDVKLDLDFECQALITRHLRRAFPAAFVLGEEGVTGNPQSSWRWVVDPIDGTVNFFHGIPHVAISIALEIEHHGALPVTPRAGRARVGNGHGRCFEPMVGVVYDPFLDEFWTAVRSGPARLNGNPVRVSRRRALDEAVISIGFGKQPGLLKAALPVFGQLARKAQKVRITGSAALSLVYVATGRFDAHVGAGIRLWDVAAGKLIVERAGGQVTLDPETARRAGGILATNGLLEGPMRDLTMRLLCRGQC